MKGIQLGRFVVGVTLLAGVMPTMSFAETASNLHQLGTKQGSMGQYLVDSKGMSLYMFDADAQNSGKSNCYDQCAKDWPPAIIPSGVHATATGAAKNNMIGEIKRTDGTTQLTYNGWPLYTYIKDTKPGQTNGENVVGDGGGWQLVKPDGSKL